ncbi:hypothetical protein D3C87_676440 [compost metagenome]
MMLYLLYLKFNFNTVYYIRGNREHVWFKPSSASQATTRYTIAFFSLLGDLLSLPMLYGIKFHFSTLFLILAFLLIGSPAAIIIAFLVACRLRKGSVFLYDLLFWFLISVFLLLLSIYVDLFPSNTQLLLLPAKSSVNGSSNALIAEVLIIYLPFIRRLKIKKMTKKTPLQQIFVHLSSAELD